VSEGAEDILADEPAAGAELSSATPTTTRTAPAPLEYYSPPTPADQRRVRGLTAWSVVLLGGWLPYVCGIVNVATVAHSYNEAVTRAHAGGAVVFMLLGVGLSVTSLIGFARMRHVWGSIAALMVLMVQLSIGACIGLTA
jgi:hypothetical protein